MEHPTTPSTPPRSSADGDLAFNLSEWSPSSTIRPATPVQATGAARTPQSTPVKPGLSSTVPYTTNHKYRIESRNQMGEEMKSYIVGPMPAQTFLDDFFPTEDLPNLETVPSFVENCYADTVSAKTESPSYVPFVNSTAEFMPGYRLAICANSPDCNPNNGFPFAIKPDIAVYCDSIPSDVLTDSSLMELSIEVKWFSDDDPFAAAHNTIDGGPIKSIFHETIKATDTLGQITSYAAAQLGSQFRTHVYSVLIVMDHARIIRWDRSGAIVTEAIPYNKSSLLAEFFRRYSQAPSDMRGIDQSVSPPTPAEDLAARNALQPEDKASKGEKDKKKNRKKKDKKDRKKKDKKSLGQLFKLGIPTNGGVRYFITTAPRLGFYSPPGRATRGFRAYDILANTCCFLKDTWRIDIQEIQEEGLTYEALQIANVPNIPMCVAYGDISTTKYHATKTLAYLKETWACHKNNGLFVPHRHYRLALDVFGRPLSQFESSYEMVAAVRDALIAHKAAYNDAHILHRDLSPGNILIGPNGKGLLIDWDLSKPYGPGVLEIPRRITRTGTWQFMSGKLIAREEQHGFRDDLESIIYVLLWVVLMFSKSSSPANAALFMDTVLDPRMPAGIDETTRIYSLKSAFLKDSARFLDFAQFPGLPPCFTQLLASLTNLFAVRYEKLPDGELERALQMIAFFSKEKDRKMLQSLPLLSYCDRTDYLLNHDRTIHLFNIALANRSVWPANDRAEKQDIRKGTEYPIRSQVTKASWVSVQGTQGIGPQAMDVGGDAPDGAMDVDGWTASGSS